MMRLWSHDYAFPLIACVATVACLAFVVWALASGRNDSPLAWFVAGQSFTGVLVSGVATMFAIRDRR